MSSSSTTPIQRILAVGAIALAGAAAFFLVKRKKNCHCPSSASFSTALPGVTRYGQLKVHGNQTYNDYLAAVKRGVKLTPKDKEWYVYVGAANDASNEPWCGDCRKANPVVDHAFDTAFESNPDLLMLSVLVDRPSYKDQANPHFLKTDPQLKLTAVPTLFKFVGDSCVARLVEGECADLNKVTSFLASSSQ